MRYKNPIFVLLLLTSVNAFAQDSMIRKHTPTPNKYWSVKLPLFNLLDPVSPNLQVAVERRLNGKNGIQLLAGISTDLTTTKPRPRDYSVINGYRLRAEYRRYFHVRRKVSFFLAGDVFYTQYKHYTRDSFISQSTNIRYADNFYILKKMAGADLKWGLQFHAGKHFMFETFAGLGFKHKAVTRTGRTSPLDEPVPPLPPKDFSLGDQTNTLGNYTTVSMPLNFVIGYSFR